MRTTFLARGSRDCKSEHRLGVGWTRLQLPVTVMASAASNNVPSPQPPACALQSLVGPHSSPRGQAWSLSSAGTKAQRRETAHTPDLNSMNRTNRAAGSAEVGMPAVWGSRSDVLTAQHMSQEPPPNSRQPSCRELSGGGPYFAPSISPARDGA